MIQNNNYPYTIPEGASLVKTGMYYYEKNVTLSTGVIVTLREIYAEYGWAIYNVDEMQAHLENPELPINYSYIVGGLQSSNAISNYDVCEITEDMEVFNKPNDEVTI